jgi:hypothetical protein
MGRRRLSHTVEAMYPIAIIDAGSLTRQGLHGWGPDQAASTPRRTRRPARRTAARR